MLNISIHITGNKEEIERLKRLGKSLSDFGSEMDQVGRELKSYFGGQVFASDGGVFGGWKRLSPGYTKRKIRDYPGKGILQASGSMQKSFTFDADKTSVFITNTDPKFPFHQSTAARTKMPRRQMIGVNADVKGIVHDIIQDGVKKKLRR